jgi:hypothetical protein
LGWNIVLTALPLDGKIVLRPRKSDSTNSVQRDQQTIRSVNDRRKNAQR